MANVIAHWTILSKPFARMTARGDRTIPHVRARCRCGNEKDVSIPNLISGKSKSCGCFRTTRTIERKTRHGNARKGKHTAEYDAWQAMLRRCETRTHISYPNYGGRGISICESWHTFESFLSDMGRRPSNRYSLDRIDVNGSYGPSNCRWATRKEQRANQRVRARLDQFTSDDLIGELTRRGHVFIQTGTEQITKSRKER